MASLFDSMTTAVSGLSAQAVAMSNISNNISNAQTVGFKENDTSFQDLVNQTAATPGNGGGGDGTIALTTNQVALQGSLVSSTTATNLAISGNGFFAVQAGQNGPNGTVSFAGDTQYTRRGDFSLNAGGYMVNGAGEYLQGYAVNTGTGAVDTSKLVPIQIAQKLANPVATSTVTLNANLPSNAVAGTAFTPTTLQVYDAAGNTHSVTVNWTQNSTGNWTAAVSVPDAVGGFNNSLALAFGNTAGVNAGTIQSINNAAGGSAFTVPSGTGTAAGQPALASFNVDFGSGPQTITLNLGTFNQSGGLTQFASSDQQVDLNSVNQNGVPQGSYQALNIDQSGNVTVSYSNGQSRTLFQVPVVQFNAPDALQANSGGVYNQTVDSGPPQFGKAGLNAAGTIQSATVENSNVDLTGQFTKMIQTQQIYSANSRAITTANTMLSDLLNIVHP